MQKTENKYQLTNEEINKILRRSPRSLGSSPGEQGLGAEQIKRYFYDFIYYMAERLNLSFGKIEEDVISLENGAIILREEIENELARLIQNHVEDTATHSDIREQLTSVAGLANRAFNLASGKSKVYVDKSFHMAILELQNESLNYGDFIMVLDKKSPDFVVVDFDNSDLNIIDIEIEDAHSGNLPDPTVGGMYRIKGLSKALLAIESGIDTSAFATKEQLENNAGALKLLKDVTLEKNEPSVTVYLDKPINEFFLIANIAVDSETETSRALRVLTNGGSQYFAYQVLKLSGASTKCWTCYSKEIGELYWRSIFNTNTLGGLQGIEADTASVATSTSKRKIELVKTRYVDHITIYISDMDLLMGTQFKIFGREIEE